MSLRRSTCTYHRQIGDYRPTHIQLVWARVFDPRVRHPSPRSFLVHDRTAGPMPWEDFHQRRQGAGTLVDAGIAPRLEGTSRGHGVQGRNRALDRLQRLLPIGLQSQYGMEEAASVGMRWRMEDVFLGREFQRTSRI